jgi:hypothetical protein
MSYPEYLACHFEPGQDGRGNPSHLDIILRAGFLDTKQISRMYFTLREGTTWQEAEGLAAAMNRHLQKLCVVHLAGGEA